MDAKKISRLFEKVKLKKNSGLNVDSDLLKFIDEAYEESVDFETLKDKYANKKVDEIMSLKCNDALEECHRLFKAFVSQFSSSYEHFNSFFKEPDNVITRYKYEQSILILDKLSFKLGLAFMFYADGARESVFEDISKDDFCIGNPETFDSLVQFKDTLGAQFVLLESSIEKCDKILLSDNKNDYLAIAPIIMWFTRNLFVLNRWMFEFLSKK